ncbi:MULTISPECIES: hypothetical protein [Cryobacterium]|uniref:Uncharacterized protein n=1 Tax=Cryobacterium breve TaxID=1259258 RepID=A0ABY2J9K9_9MICO|nr:MULTISPECIES: hypothetical protein [Cryobacterium]TFC91268.1 hypothetical protein E3T20_14720 [Cryobacterium sp. TmT3-12]TFD01038.1 hypothetical protein E3O65_01695 [Cryobacterium breve]
MSAVLSWILALIVAVVPRVIEATPFYSVSLSAAVLVASFGFFASTIQGDLSFLLGGLAIAVPLVVTYVSAVVFLGKEQEWMTIMLACFTVGIAGLLVFIPGQRNIWR